jgi:hypothetical protein
MFLVDTHWLNNHNTPDLLLQSGNFLKPDKAQKNPTIGMNRQPGNNVAN